MAREIGRKGELAKVFPSARAGSGGEGERRNVLHVTGAFRPESFRLQTQKQVLLPLLGGRSLLEREGVLLVHGRTDRDHKVLALLKGSGDLESDLTLGHLDVVLGRAVVAHQVEKAIVCGSQTRPSAFWRMLIVDLA